MNTKDLAQLLQQVRDGGIDIEAALTRLKSLPYEDLGFAVVDHHRQLRQGFPEVVLGEFKTTEQMEGIVTAIAARNQPVLVTRIQSGAGERLQQVFPQGNYDPVSRTFAHPWPYGDGNVGPVAVISAGTSDIPVAMEAIRTLMLMNCEVIQLFDVGVAGVHRLLDRVPDLQQAASIVVVAGMEGALPSLVGGLVAAPVIAVPTSVGYGASLGGISALLSMLNSCAPGVSVVNIDNGFGAGYVAGSIANSIHVAKGVNTDNKS